MDSNANAKPANRSPPAVLPLHVKLFIILIYIITCQVRRICEMQKFYHLCKKNDLLINENITIACVPTFTNPFN